LLRLWRVAPRYANKSLVGTWLLSCSNIEFENDIIVNAGFDHYKFKEKCVSQLIYFINKITIRIQTVIRAFIARRYVNRLRKKLRAKSKKKVIKASHSSHTRIRRHNPLSPDNSHMLDDESIGTEYSRENLLIGSSLDAASIDTECSYASRGSGGSWTKSKTVELKTDPIALQRRNQRIKNTTAAYSSSSPLSRTHPNSKRSSASKTKSSRKAKLNDSRMEMQSELHTLRNEIGDVLLSFQQELKEVKHTVNHSNYQASRMQGGVGPNNILNEVSSICEQEMQPVKQMMTQVLNEINSLRTAKTPAFVTAQKNTQSENFAADMTKLVEQMALLQDQMANQSTVGTAQIKKEIATQEASINHIHESVLKAYKDKIEILEKSEQEKVKRIAVLNMQMRRTSTAIGMKQRESFNDLMSTKAQLEEANNQVDELKIKLNEAESNVRSLKNDLSQSKVHKPPAEDILELRNLLAAARERASDLQRTVDQASKDHKIAMADMSTRLSAAKQEISTLNMELQEAKLAVVVPQRNDEVQNLKATVERVTSQLTATQLQAEHLLEELQLAKLEKMRLSDQLFQSKEITPNMGDIEVDLRQTIDDLDKKVKRLCEAIKFSHDSVQLLEASDKYYRVQMKLENVTKAYNTEV
jgi:chromosome segregation ATPase